MHTIFETDGANRDADLQSPRGAQRDDVGDVRALVAACDRSIATPRRRAHHPGAGGKAFVAGTDISQFRIQHREDGLKYEERLDHVLDRLERVTKPTIAQVEGAAAAAVCHRADLRSCASATPEASSESRSRAPLAIASRAPATAPADVMGPGAVKDMLFTGRLIGGAEAHALGMSTAWCRRPGFEPAVRALAAEIAANAR